MTQIKIFSNTSSEVEKQTNEWLTNNPNIIIKSITQSQGGHNHGNTILTIYYTTVNKEDVVGDVDRISIEDVIGYVIGDAKRT
jgi:hypothetical protein